jgi:hypothetical protein
MEFQLMNSSVVLEGSYSLTKNHTELLMSYYTHSVIQVMYQEFYVILLRRLC